MKNSTRETYLKYTYGNVVEGESVEHTFYAYFDSSYYWFIYPEDYYARNWPVVESEFFRIHVHPDVQGYLNSVNMASIDQFVEDIAKEIDIDKEAVNELREKKIEYYYCNNDSTVELIVGHRVKGTYDLASQRSDLGLFSRIIMNWFIFW